MKRWLAAPLVLGLLLTGCGDSDGSDPATATPSTTDQTQSPTQSQTPTQGGLTATWSAEVDDAFAPDPGNVATNPLVVGDTVVVLTDTQATGYDLATGEQTWQSELPSFTCATSPTATADGVVGVLLTDGGSTACDQVMALDTTDGTALWTEPLPDSDVAVGRQVSVGADTVTVTGECAGFRSYAVADGAEVATVTGENVAPRCASSASDGTTVVMLSGDTVATYDAASGEQQQEWSVADLARVGEVVSSDPLVVTVRSTSGGALLDLSGDEPVQFGRDGGSFGGEPVASQLLDDTLWVQYEDVDELVGYDLAAHDEAATLPIDASALLVGAHGQSLALTTGSDDGVELELATPDETTPLGVIAPPDGQQASALHTVVTDDAVVRLWPAQLAVYPLS